SRRSSAMPSGIGSSSRTRRSRGRGRPIRSSTRCSGLCPCLRSTPRAGGPRDPRMGDAGALLARPPPGPPGPRPLAEGLLRALDISIGRRVEGLLAGDFRSNLLGTGSELAMIRPYVAGDDVRRIDWNVTARTGEPHVRVDLAERVLVTWLVLDASPSLA